MEKLHIEELHNLYLLSNIEVINLRRMTWVGHVVHMGEVNMCNILVTKPEGRDYFRDVVTDESDIEVDLGKIKCGDVDWI
jgi:hypothetical protein